jgi:hypothetical protein
MIVINGASGKTGSKAAELLIPSVLCGADAVYLLVPPILDDVFVPAFKTAA